jgi:hypothetical protein
MHGQLRGEALRFPLPVPDQGHRADQQGRASRLIPNGLARHPLRPQERKQLDGLSEAHVVCENGTDSKPAEERQPRKPALLVRPERAAKSLGRLRRHQPLVCLPGQEIAKPAVGVHVDERRLPRRGVSPHRRAQHLGGGHGP